MHLDHKRFPEEYRKYTSRKIVFIVIAFFILLCVSIFAISQGPVGIPPMEILRALTGQPISKQSGIIILSIRLPLVLTAIVVGMGLSASGAVTQSILRNPLASPFTLGISHAAAFGAAFSVIVFASGTMQSSETNSINIHNPYLTMGMAFFCSLIATLIIMTVSKLRSTNPEVTILTGVAIGSLFTAGTMFLQYFADDVQLAAMIFWTFGDLSRTSWNELTFIAFTTLVSIVYFYLNRWNYNAMEAGDETAKGLGVNVEKVRISGMVLASVLTAVIISFLGVIGFIGLVCPHIARRIIGDDNCYMIPLASIIGAILLLLADTAGRCLMTPHSLPVAILTSFLGVPVFIYLLIKGRLK